MRVIFLITSLHRCGPTNVVFNMLEAYKKSIDGPVEFIMASLIKELEDSRISEFTQLGIRVISLNYNNWRRALLNNKKIRDILIKEKPDVCHSTGFVPDLILGKLKNSSIKRVSSVFNYPYEDFPMEFGRVVGNIMAYLQIRTVRTFDSVITCSHFIADKLAKCNLPLDVIYTGVPDDFFRPLPEDAIKARKEELTIPHNKIILIFIARFIPRKNAKFLVEAIKQTNREDLFFLMMGDGEELEPCKQIFNNPSMIKYLGTCLGTLDYLQVSDYYISPSLSEGFPTSVLEALSVGVQPILSDIIPHREMISEICPENLFPIEDTKPLVALLKNLGNNKRRQELREFLQNNYSAYIMAKKHVDLYKSLKKS